MIAPNDKHSQVSFILTQGTEPHLSTTHNTDWDTIVAGLCIKLTTPNF